MEADALPDHHKQRGERSIFRRMLAAVGLLLVEYLIVSLKFDAQALIHIEGAWSLVGRVGALAPAGVSAATAALLLRGAPSLSLAPDLTTPKLRPGPLVAHALLFALFLALTIHVFGGTRPPTGHPAAWFALWTALGGASALCLLLGLLGRRALYARLLSQTLLAAAVVGVAAWLAGSLTTEFWKPLSLATLAGVTWVLTPFFPDIEANPEDTSLKLGSFDVVIAPECSGFESIGLITVLMGGYLVAFRKSLRFPAALLLLPLAVVAAWVGNVARMSGLMTLGAFVSPDLALGGFHSKAGWAFFCAIALGLAVLGRRMRFFAKDALAGEETENPSAAYLAPTLAVIAVAMVTGMFSIAIDRWYWLRIAAALLVLFAYRSYYQTLARSFSPVSVLAGVLVGALWIVTASPVADAAATVTGAFSSTVALWAWVATRVLGSVLVIPVCEELAFRGFLLRRLVSRDFSEVKFTAWTPIGLLVSSVAFGLVHDRIVAATLAGAVFALVQLRYGRLADAVVAHAASNATIALWVLLRGDWSLWL